MFSLNVDPMLYHKERLEELRREAQQHRLAQEARNARPSRANRLSRFLVVFGNTLVELGASLEKRHSSSPQIDAPIE